MTMKDDVKVGREMLASISQIIPRLSWKNMGICGKCLDCRGSFLKSLVTLIYSLVSIILDDQDKEYVDPELCDASKNCLLCLHYFWEINMEDFIKILTGSPRVQRRYVWSINHLLDLCDSKVIDLEHGM